jgi:hypothetical protein
VRFPWLRFSSSRGLITSIDSDEAARRDDSQGYKRNWDAIVLVA